MKEVFFGRSLRRDVFGHKENNIDRIDRLGSEPNLEEEVYRCGEVYL